MLEAQMLRPGLSRSDQLIECQLLCIRAYDQLSNKRKSEFVLLVYRLNQRIIALTNSAGQLSEEFLIELTDISPELAELIQRQYSYLSVMSAPKVSLPHQVCRVEQSTELTTVDDPIAPILDYCES
jgi:hypothetical protein